MCRLGEERGSFGVQAPLAWSLLTLGTLDVNNAVQVRSSATYRYYLLRWHYSSPQCLPYETSTANGTYSWRSLPASTIVVRSSSVT